MPLDPDRLRALSFPETRVAYDGRDCAIYALGVGYGMDPADERQLRFVDDAGLRAVPTFASVLASPGFWIRTQDTGIDWKMAVLGEHAVTLHKPLPVAGEVLSRLRITEILDKGDGNGALISTERSVSDARSGEALATVCETVFVRGGGGFGGAPSSADRAGPPEVPARESDASVTLPTHTQLALIHRLSCDYNPLHSVPAVARAAGYDRPILHGLASYGVAGHALLKALCGYDPERMRSMSCRFAAPVMPGDSITVDIWDLSPGTAAFEARIHDQGTAVLTHGRFEYDPQAGREVSACSEADCDANI